MVGSGIDWYPSLLTRRVTWHATFAGAAAINGTDYGLTPDQVTQIGIDAENVRRMVIYGVELNDFRQAATAFRNAFLDGPLGGLAPVAPTAPAIDGLDPGSLPGIGARTRRYVAIIRASPRFDASVGESYGIVTPESRPPGVPDLRVAALPSSQVMIKITKRRNAVIAIYSRRGDGAWEMIGVATRAKFNDARPPLVAGTPEVREYRVRAVRNDVPTGDYSGIVTAVTMP